MHADRYPGKPKYFSLYELTLSPFSKEKLMARLLYFPSIGRMCLLEGPNRRWYDRIDSTVILGALPFKKQAKQLAEKENVKAVISYNEAYELKFFTNSRKEWSTLGIDQHWFSTIDFQPPSLFNIRAGVKVIEASKARKESVYVHCKAGKGRSTTMVACFIVKDYDMKPDEAVEFIRTKRPQISINTRQMKRITEFYEQLKKQD